MPSPIRTLKFKSKKTGRVLTLKKTGRLKPFKSKGGKGKERNPRRLA